MAPSKHLVLVCGFARAGKDTFARGLKAGASNKVGRFAYADQLKCALEFAAEELGVEVDYTDDSQKAMDRPLFVEFGKAMRRRDKDVFARKLGSAMMLDSLKNMPSRVVTDWRYFNEYEFAKKLCDERAYSLHTVHIVRHGWKAANEEEAINMQEILDNVPIDETIFATSGDEQAVYDHGVRIAKLWHL
jgi:hypothetical protein